MTNTVAVLGPGRIGRQIALAFALGGRRVLLVDVKARTPEERRAVFADARREITRDLRLMTEEGVIAGGDVVVNPRGGLIGCGHPLGATGVAQAAEVFVQLRDEAGARQVPGAAIGLAHNNSGMGEHVVMIYGREPA